jgi:hypothetical protein
MVFGSSRGPGLLSHNVQWIAGYDKLVRRMEKYQVVKEANLVKGGA